MQQQHKKRLEGIRLTPAWKGLLEEAEAKLRAPGDDERQEQQQQEQERRGGGKDNGKNDDFFAEDAEDGDGDPDNGDKLLQAAAREAVREYLLRRQKSPSPSSPSPSSTCDDDVLPIRVVLSLAAVLGTDSVARALEEGSEASGEGGEGESGGSEGESLGGAAAATALAFTPAPREVAPTDEQRRFRRRMERLSLRQEERRYGKLTRNLGLAVPQDDVTTRTMTYAASVGLNMIVAPLSFGCFVYFFSGPALDYLWPRQAAPPQHRPAPGAPDVRRVILAVLCGCAMLFVEMLLFVIRTHELDRAVRAKSRRKKDQPGAFGHYTSNTVKTFKGD